MRSYLKGMQFLAVTAVLVPVACGGGAPPVTVVGPTADIRALSGNWFGDYSSPVTGRTGTIVFALKAGSDSAWGSVVMTPRGAAGPIMPWQNPRGTMPAPTELTIRFVRIANGQVAGSLAPYADPASGEPLFTVFEGRILGDTISGTYSTGSSPGAGEPTGRWQVVRDRP